MFSIGTVLSKLLGATPPHAAASNQRATPYTPLLFDVFEFVGAGPASEDSAEQQPEIAAGPAMVKIGSDLMQPYNKGARAIILRQGVAVPRTVLGCRSPCSDISRPLTPPCPFPPFSLSLSPPLSLSL